MAPARGEVEFGYLVVPESRRDGGNAKTIRLPVMIAKSRSGSPKSDPILFTTGGPGVMTTLYPGRDLTSWPFLDERDFIYFEQRGALNAEPSLMGPEIDSVISHGIARNINGWPDSEELKTAAGILRERLEREGIDLGAYNTTESAADIEDLRRALHIEKWNLYGISYSCLLMIEAMKNHPEGIRAVILDSPLIPGARWDEESVGNMWNTMHAMFEACKNDTAVNTAFPNLEKRFLEFVDEACRNPIAVIVRHPFTKDSVTVQFDGEGIFLSVANFLGNAQNIYGFPHYINLLCNHNDDILAAMAHEYVSAPSYIWGMRYSIWCGDVAPFEDSLRFDRHDNVPHPLSTFSCTVVPRGVCEIWPARPANPRFAKPVHSEIPVLIANGEYDWDTPAEWGMELHRTLPSSYHILFPGQSHLPLFQHPAGKKIAMAFLSNPHERPDDNAVAKKPFRFYSGR